LKKTLCMLAIAGGIGNPAAAEQAIAVRATDVKARPFTDANTVTSLAERSRVDVLKRETSWIEINSGQHTGWVRMLSLRFEQPATANGAPNLFRAAMEKGSGGSVATTGVRGLKEELLANPRPNPAALQQMQAIAANAGDAAAFAAKAGLHAQSIDYVAAGGAK
jgi:hypothetical protein